MRTCEIVENGERCGRKVKCKGMCGKHYQRVEKYGDPLVVKSVREKREHEKWCSGCEEWLPKENFFSNKSAAQGLAKICKPCMKAARILSKYGITQDQFLAMLESQGGGCAICATTEPGGTGTWNIDHDHGCCSGEKTCGECVRALLCMPCNMGIGYFGYDPDRLLQAAFYLERHRNLTSDKRS